MPNKVLKLKLYLIHRFSNYNKNALGNYKYLYIWLPYTFIE